jgi:hypothetical protein
MSPAISISCRTGSNRTNPLIRDIEPHSPEYASKPRFFFLKTDAGESDVCRKLDFDSGDSNKASFIKATSEDDFSSTSCKRISDEKAVAAELDQVEPDSSSKPKDKTEYLKLLPPEMLEKIVGYLSADDLYHLTNLYKPAYLTHRELALPRYREKEIVRQLKHYSENLHLLNDQKERIKLIMRFMSLERTYKVPEGTMLAKVHFDEKTIAVAIKLVMHYKEDKFYENVILREIKNVPNKPDEIVIKYDYRRIFWGMSNFYVVINYRNQGIAFNVDDVMTYTKYTKVPKTIFDDIIDSNLTHYLQEKFTKLDEETKRKKQDAANLLLKCCNCFVC